MNNKHLYKWKSWGEITPAVLFGALVLFKLFFVIENRSLPLIYDEFTYARFTRYLSKQGQYFSVQYPLLYPVALLPSLLLGENYYVGIKILNTLYSSMVPVVVYAISRLYLQKKESTVCALFSFVIPFHYTVPMMILSENLYFPLFLFAVYIVLRPFENKKLEDFFTGASIGALFLTRHITLVAIPVFLFGWLLKQLELKYAWKTIVKRAIRVGIIILLTYSPWLIMSFHNGRGLKETIGFSIASTTNPEQLTPERLLLSGIFYVCYFVLMAAPFLGLLIRSIRGLDTKKLFSAYNRLWVMVFGLSAAFFFAVTRHSWRAYYNYPDFIKIKGRYLIYFPVLFAILAMVVLCVQKPKFKNRLTGIILTYILPIILLVLAYFVDIEGAIYPLNHSFIDLLESSDVHRIILVGKLFIPVTAAGIFIYQYIEDSAKESLKKYSWLAMGVIIILTQIWGSNIYIDELKKVNQRKEDSTYREANEFLDTVRGLRSDIPVEEKIVIYVDDTLELTHIIRNTTFANMDNLLITSNWDIIIRDVFWVVVADKEKFGDYVIEEVAEYNWEDATYYLQKIDRGQ